MKKKNIRIVAGTIIVGSLIAVCAVYYVFNMPRRNLANEKAVYQLEAKQLITEFKNDENLSTTKYLDKAISVKGEIKSIRSLENHGLVFSLEDAMEGVSCTVDSAECIRYAAQLEKIKIGTTAKFKGRCSGMLMDVQIINCVPE